MAKVKELVLRAQEGDAEAYDEVYQRFGAMAQSYAFSLLGDYQLAEDIRQEAFLAAYVDLLALREPAAFPGWFKRIVHKHSITLRRGRRTLLVPLEDAAEPPDAAPGPAQLAEERQIQELIQRAVERLPAKEREAVRLYHLEGLSRKEAAQRLGVSEKMVKSRLFSGRRRLRERLMNQVKDTVQIQNFAGDQTARQAATAEAVGQFKREQQTLLERPSPADLERASDLVCARGRLLRFLGEMKQAAAVFEEGIAHPLLKRLPLGRARMRAEIGLTLVQTADYARARGKLQAAKRAVQGAQDDSPLLAAIFNGLGMCAWGEGKFRQARGHYEQAVAEGRRTKCEILETEARGNLALLDWKAGRHERALRNVRDCIRFWKKIKNRFQWALALMNAGILEESLGRAASARRHYEQALKAARAINFRQVQAASLTNLANLALGREKWEEALDLSDRSLEQARAIGDRRRQAIALENRLLAELGLGRLGDAAGALREARRLARATGDGERQLSLELAAAELALAQGRPKGLAKKLARVEQQLKKIGCQAEWPRLLRLRAMAELRTGATPQAKRTLSHGLRECKKQGSRLEEQKLLALKKQLEQG